MPRITIREVIEAMAEVPVRVSLSIAERGLYQPSPHPQIHVNPERHEDEWDLANTYVHEIVHHLTASREHVTDRSAAALMRHSGVANAAHAAMSRAMMLYLGGGRKVGAGE